MVGVFSFINVRIYILSKTSVLATVSEDSSKIGTEPDSLEAAEGETVVTVCVVWRIDIRRIHVQVVCVGRRVGRTRPSVAVVASVPYTTLNETDSIATDKSQKHLRDVYRRSWLYLALSINKAIYSNLSYF